MILDFAGESGFGEKVNGAHVRKEWHYRMMYAWQMGKLCQFPNYQGTLSCDPWEMHPPSPWFAVQQQTKKFMRNYEKLHIPVIDNFWMQ